MLDLESRDTRDREFPSRLGSLQMNHAAVAPLTARAAPGPGVT